MTVLNLSRYIFLEKNIKTETAQTTSKINRGKKDQMTNSCTRIPVMKPKSNKSKGCFCTKFILTKIKTYL